MKLKDFNNLISRDLKCFTINMENIEVDDLSPEKWMDTFLAWIEWSTDDKEFNWKDN